jgi:glyoxylase-like metal-dependent hydrolase (beta-lactamase superfamily II)
LAQLGTIMEGLFATPASRLPYQHDVLLRSYILQRPEGNVLIYNSPGIVDAHDEILALGRPERLLINHGHEGMYGDPGIDVPIWAHLEDRDELAPLVLAGTFSSRQLLGEDLEVIPTPGHTPGTTSYLWDSGTHRYLFTGDCIWIENGEWKAVVLDESLRDSYIESLTLIRDLDFDVLVPWGVTEGDSPASVIHDPADRRKRVQAIVDRLKNGGHR